MKKLLIATLLFASFINLFSQEPYKEISSDKIKCIKINYVRVSEDDLKNQILFSETDKSVSLMQLVMNLIENNQLTAYNNNHTYDEILTKNQIYSRLGIDTINLQIGYKLPEIKEFVIVEAWLYDENDKLIDIRIVGFAPARGDYADVFFWVYFPDFYKESQKIASAKSINQFLIKRKYNFANYTYNWLEYANNEYDSLEIEQQIEHFNSLYQNVNVPSKIPNIKYIPVSYPDNNYVTPNDEIVCAKVNYYKIYNNSTNKCLFTPIAPEYGYKSLTSLIIEGVRSGKLNVYAASAAINGEEFVSDTFSDSVIVKYTYNLYDAWGDVYGVDTLKINISDFVFGYPNNILTTDEILEKMGEGIEKYVIVDDDGNLDTIFHEVSIDETEITSYLVKEINLYNSAGDVVQNRIVGICPIKRFYRDGDYEETDPQYKYVGWIYFPDLQKIVASQLVNRVNSNDNSITFNDYFLNKKYNGINIAVDFASFYADENFDNQFNHNFFNLFSADFNKNNIDDIKIKSVKNIYYIEKPEFDKAKIVYTTISNQTDSLLFMSPYLGFGNKSLIDIILASFFAKENQCYKSDSLLRELTFQNVDSLMGAVIEYYESMDGDKGVSYSCYNSANIQKYELKELWLFDKDNNIIEKRILAISPIRYYYANDDWYELGDFLEKNIFWIKFKDFQSVFAKKYVTQKDFSLPITYNNYFILQKYHSSVIEEKEITKNEAEEILKNY